jgi:phospholipid/cholesterol/gamma-HCH transport system permease protein
MYQVFKSPDKWKVFFKSLIFEINKLGVDSIPITIVISIFIGAVIAIQMQLNIMSPLIPS